jgi:hypothetical protein
MQPFYNIQAIYFFTFPILEICKTINLSLEILPMRDLQDRLPLVIVVKL